jgi:hypothetical protein
MLQPHLFFIQTVILLMLELRRDNISSYPQPTRWITSCRSKPTASRCVGIVSPCPCRSCDADSGEMWYSAVVKACLLVKVCE